MPLTPGSPESGPAPVIGDVASSPRRTAIAQRLWATLLAVFTFEIGAFLVVYPWMDSWNLNHLPTQLHDIFVSLNLEDVWDDPYFRGAVSGLGLVNLWIAVQQVVRIVRSKQNL